MTPVLVVPARLDEAALDLLAEQAPMIGEARRVVVDARGVQAADPLGVLGLLALGDSVGQGRRRPLLQLPRTRDGVELFARIGFGPVAPNVFDLSAGDRVRVNGNAGDVLLPIKQVHTDQDAVDIAGNLRDRAGPLLTRRLLLLESEIESFGNAVFELLHGLLGSGSVRIAAQMHRKHPRVGRAAVSVAAVGLNDASGGDAAKLGPVWDRVASWNGTVTVRRGTTRVVNAESIETGLAPRPGTQVLIVIPTQRAATA